MPVAKSSLSSLTGEVTVPGDKSISHRSLMLGAVAHGETIISGLLESEDVLNTMKCLRKLGVSIEKDADGKWHVFGVGLGGLSASGEVLDMGNSGTGARLLMGLCANISGEIIITGDASLRTRPMKRVLEPLGTMGLLYSSEKDGLLPMTIHENEELVPIEYVLPVASAQVKSAILLAGLSIPGETVVIEPIPTRDHTERMLAAFGADITVEPYGKGGNKITLRGGKPLYGRPINVPSDPSSAAFPIAAALLAPNSKVTVKNVLMNPLRTGLFSVLKKMNANLDYREHPSGAGEEVMADITAQTSVLSGISVPPELAPSMIDEYPILSVVAAFAAGKTQMNGVEELRVKESDRIAVMEAGLTQCGIACASTEDSFSVSGGAEQIACSQPIETSLDHRIAMSFLVMGLASKAPVFIDDSDVINTSFPEFIPLMQKLGGNIVIE